MKTTAFDTRDALRINKARIEFLDVLLSRIEKDVRLVTALDAGCGVGFFARHLKDKGFKVTAFDGRQENIDDACRRSTGIEYRTGNIEDPSVVSLRTHELVLCVGLLYHLENPFLALRNLAALTGTVLCLETVVVPSAAPAAFLYEEPREANQGITYLAMIPTESLLIKCLYRSGFLFVYRTGGAPRHEDFHASLTKRRRRTFLVASRRKLTDPVFRLAREPVTERYMWDRFKAGSLFHCEGLRRPLRALSKLR
jgi:SAM-dependent methyltransferase